MVVSWLIKGKLFKTLKIFFICKNLLLVLLKKVLVLLCTHLEYCENLVSQALRTKRERR